MKRIVVVVCFFVTMLLPLVSNGSDEISLSDATKIAQAFFDREIRIEGALGQPKSNASFWLFPVRLGYAGTVQPDSIQVDRHSGAVTWAGLNAFKQTYQQPSTHNYRPPNGYVPDAETAIKIAVAVWAPIYGEDQIAREKPYTAVLQKGIWTVQGSLPKGLLGGVAIAEIEKIDGRVIRVSHGK